MENYQALQLQVPEIADELAAIVADYEAILGADERLVGLWKNHLDAAKRATESRIFRIAIVGTVKAGKSTFINSLIKTDLLKRGAGIITAFITRVVDSESISGLVKLKSWEEVNENIRTSLHALPLGELSRKQRKVISGFDLRKSDHRETLKILLEQLKKEQVFFRSAIDSNVLVLSAYLSGFPEVSGYIKENEPTVVRFSESDIHKHQRFVGDEGVAVYLLDMELQWPLEEFGKALELGDCQGIDSPNPLHFSLVQDYLLKSHFIAYLVNTRIGLREADFKLLKAIERLGLYPNTVFVLNVDFDSHASIQDLDDLRGKVKRDLSFLAFNPPLFSFSCLFHLVEGMEDKVSAVEKMRLEIWRKQRGLVTESGNEYARFKKYLKDVIEGKRWEFIVQTACAKLFLLSDNILDSVKLRESLFGRSEEKLSTISSQMENYNDTINRQFEAVGNMLRGLQESLRRDIGKKVDDFFTGGDNSVTRMALDAVDTFQVDSQLVRSKISDHKQMALNMYGFYLEFKDLLTTVLVEKVKLNILEFAENLKRSVVEDLEKQGKAYWNLLTGTLKSYQKEFESMGIEQPFETPVRFSLNTSVDELEVPSFDNLLSQESVGRSAFMLRFGFRQMAHFLGSIKKKVLRKKEGSDKYLNEMLLEAVDFMKSEAKKDLLFSLQDYHQNFKFGYAFKLIDTCIEELTSIFENRIELALLESKSVLEVVSRESRDREEISEKLSELRRRLESVTRDLKTVLKTPGLDSRKIEPSE